MTKSKDTKKSVMAGIFDFDEMTLTELDKDQGELVYDLKAKLKEYDGLDIKINITTKKEIDPVR